MSPLVSAAYDQKLISAVSYDQPDTFQAGVTFAKTEGIVPAPESCHAVLPALFKKRTFSAFLRKMLNFLIRLMRKIYVCSLVLLIELELEVLLVFRSHLLLSELYSAYNLNIDLLLFQLP